MSCTVNHLLIERGVKLRELGHFIMEGENMTEETDIHERIEDWYDAYLSCCNRCDRLRAVNAILLSALEGLFTIVGEALIEGDFDEYQEKADIEARHDLAREAIEDARK